VLPSISANVLIAGKKPHIRITRCTTR
jgi:hypothetical protein